MTAEADNDIINTFANDFTQRSNDRFIVAKWGYTPAVGNKTQIEYFVS